MINSAKNEDWVLALRVFIKDTLGTSWQIIENKGKVRLGIRFKDGTRTYTYLPYKWQRSIRVGLKSIKFKSFIDHPFELRKISNLTF